MEKILSQAEQLEKEYEWLRAAECIEKAIGSMSAPDFSEASVGQEHSGYALYRAAFQVDGIGEFNERMRNAVGAYEKAKEFYGRCEDPLKKPRLLRCDAMISFMGYWLASEVSEKKRLVDECWKLAEESLKGFGEAGEAFEYGKTYNQLSTSAALGFFFELDPQPRERFLREAADHGERAIQFLFKLAKCEDLVKAYVRTAGFLEAFAYFFLDPQSRQTCFKKAEGYWQKAMALSEPTAMIELLYTLGAAGLSWGSGTDEALTNLNKALDYARKTKDRLIVGCALEYLAANTFWKGADDPDEGRQLAEKALQYAEDARQDYSMVSFTSPLGDVNWVESPYSEHYWKLAANETNLIKRRQLLEKALETAPELLKRAEDSGIPQNNQYAHHVFAKVLSSLALTETDSDEKRKLLEEALAHRKRSTELAKTLGPFNVWDRGVMQNYLAEIEWQLADLSRDDETRKRMYQEALLDLENSIKLLVEGVEFFEERAREKGEVSQLGQLGSIFSSQHALGHGFRRLHQLTHDKECLRKAIAAFEDAGETACKLESEIRMAWIQWKTAQVYDDLGEYSEAAERFALAENNFRKTAEKIPALKDFCQDQAVYMRAWSEIEKARHHHERQEYGLAKEHFEKAAEIHKLLKNWSYLEPNYSAWAQVENAEELSRKEQSEEAIKAFKDAARLFRETRGSLQSQLGKIEDADEKQMATSIITTSEIRGEYCEGRITLEEAKILDKKGDHYSSSKKYDSAAKIFEKISQTLESTKDQAEFRFILSLSRAWQKMTLAEAELSPALFLEASQLFEEAKDSGPNEKTKMLVLGHSRFCRALEAGTRFADTADAALHAAAIQQLESAAKYYVKAGFQNASEYARATRLLFDAYLYMDNAEKESDPEKKAKLYVMAEKVLQTSAGSYMKAEHPEKMEQVSKLMERVKEERELASSLADVLHAPPIMSTTKAFTIPTPTTEEAVGSERFENADVQANLIVKQRELNVGEPLNLEIELVNAGKGPALLIKVNEAIPEGFELTEKPETWRAEDSYINLKGKRLDPLKTEELRLILKPKVPGTFALKPTVLYLDENGKYKSHTPNPVKIMVKELGIKGWLKGER